MTFLDLKSLVDATAPPELAESWDHAGMQVGLPEDEITKVWVALDVNETLLFAAHSEGVDGICVHHPLLFSALFALGTGDPAGRLALMAARYHIAIFAAHTALDAAEQGVSQQLAKTLGLVDILPLPAFPMARIGNLPAPMDAEAWLARLLPRLDEPHPRLCGPCPPRLRRIACLPGAGSDAIQAAYRAGAELFVTGELKYHDAQAADRIGLPCLELGHDASEKVVLSPWAEDLQNRANAVQWNVTFEVAPLPTGPYRRL